MSYLSSNYWELRNLHWIASNWKMNLNENNLFSLICGIGDNFFEIKKRFHDCITIFFTRQRMCFAAFISHKHSTCTFVYPSSQTFARRIFCVNILQISTPAVGRKMRRLMRKVTSSRIMLLKRKYRIIQIHNNSLFEVSCSIRDISVVSRGASARISILSDAISGHGGHRTEAG